MGSLWTWTGIGIAEGGLEIKSWSVYVLVGDVLGHQEGCLIPVELEVVTPSARDIGLPGIFPIFY